MIHDLEEQPMDITHNDTQPDRWVWPAALGIGLAHLALLFALVLVVWVDDSSSGGDTEMIQTMTDNPDIAAETAVEAQTDAQGAEVEVGGDSDEGPVVPTTSEP